MVQKVIFDKEKNKEERLRFIKYWANYVKNHDDTDWSKQQAELINSQFQNSNKFNKENLKYFLNKK